MSCIIFYIFLFWYSSKQFNSSFDISYINIFSKISILIQHYIKNKNLLNDNNISIIFENYNISKLDINRIYRYLDKYTLNVNDDNCSDDECSDED